MVLEIFFLMHDKLYNLEYNRYVVVLRKGLDVKYESVLCTP